MRTKKAIQVEAAQTFKAIRFVPLNETDPLSYLEARRLEFIKRLELIADEARANGMPELELKALAFGIRLTSVYKTKIDVSASNLGLVKAPALDHLDDATLKRLEGGDEGVLSEIEGKVIKDQ